MAVRILRKPRNRHAYDVWIRKTKVWFLKMGQRLNNLEKAVREIAQRVAPSPMENDGLESLVHVLRTFVRDPDKLSELADTLIHMIVRFLGVSADMAGSGLSGTPRQIAIENFLRSNTALVEKEHLRRLTLRLTDLVSFLEADPLSNEKKQRIRDKNKRGNCYLCGLPVGSEDDVIDHKTPRSAGGGHGKENLNRVHAHCDWEKWDLAFPSDAPLGRFVFKNPPDNFEKCSLPSDGLASMQSREWQRAAQLRMAILRRQDFKCNISGRPFLESPPEIDPHRRQIALVVL